MRLKKQYFKTKPFCKVTFSVPRQLAAFANTVHPVGDFNDWNRSITPMKRRNNGTFTATLYLRPDCEYEFRYLLDGITWETTHKPTNMRLTVTAAKIRLWRLKTAKPH